MNVNDKIALEIGRAVLAKLIAEAQRDELLAPAQVVQAEQAARKEAEKDE